MMNRSIQPELHPIGHISFVKPHIFDITPEVKLLWMDKVPNDTVRLDLYFNAGITKAGDSIPSIVHSLLFSGTANQTSVEIHEKIDALGGFLDTDISFETSVVSIYCLREYLMDIVHIVADAIQNVIFAENEVDDVLRSMKQQYAVNQKRVKYVAQQQFRKAMFASNEAYSSLSKEEDYLEARVSDYKRFWNKHYLRGLTRMTLVGDCHPDEVDALIDLFGKWAIDEKPMFPNNFEVSPQRLNFPMDDAMQTALRLGRFLMPKNHPDYIEFQVLNTIFGDYFGSRLMSNIREDKGYTYGIGTGIMDLQGCGYFVIVTEVGKEVTEATLKEIKHEMDRLKVELVEDDELQLVKNYMLGQLLKSADGPYAMLDMYNSVDLHHMDLSFYDKAIEQVKNIQPERIRELAVKYLNFEEFLIITAG